MVNVNGIPKALRRTAALVVLAGAGAGVGCNSQEIPDDVTSSTTSTLTVESTSTTTMSITATTTVDVAPTETIPALVGPTDNGGPVTTIKLPVDLDSGISTTTVGVKIAPNDNGAGVLERDPADAIVTAPVATEHNIPTNGVAVISDPTFVDGVGDAVWSCPEGAEVISSANADPAAVFKDFCI